MLDCCSITAKSFKGVFGGSVKSIRALVSGEIESIPRVLVDANAVRAFQRSFQSIYWLLPRKQVRLSSFSDVISDKSLILASFRLVS